MQHVWILVDIITVVILALIIASCARKGFVRTLLGFITTLGSAIGAIVLSGPLARFVYDWVVRDAIQTAITRSVSEQMDAGLVSGGDWLSAVPGWLGNLIPAGFALSGPGPNTAAEVAPVVETLVDATLAQPVILILRIIFISLLFFIFMLISRSILFASRIVDYIPLVGSVNTFLGGVLGVGWAGIVLYGAALVLRFYILLSGDGHDLINTETLSRGYLFSFFFRLAS